MNENSAFYGKYRGVVTDNLDPMMMGRIRARVPDVMGDMETGWALPCAPFAGDGMGFFAMPKVGAGVWIEFEHGDRDYPIWSGCWWRSAAEVPTAQVTPPPANKVMLKTESGHVILIDDTPDTGGITLQTSTGQKIKLTSLGIEIDDALGATITLAGPQISLNNGALEVI